MSRAINAAELRLVQVEAIVRLARAADATLPAHGHVGANTASTLSDLLVQPAADEPSLLGGTALVQIVGAFNGEVILGRLAINQKGDVGGYDENGYAIEYATADARANVVGDTVTLTSVARELIRAADSNELADADHWIEQLRSIVTSTESAPHAAREPVLEAGKTGIDERARTTLTPAEAAPESGPGGAGGIGAGW